MILNLSRKILNEEKSDIENAGILESGFLRRKKPRKVPAVYIGMIVQGLFINAPVRIATLFKRKIRISRKTNIR